MLGYLTLFVALVISAIAAFFSISGLTALFAGAKLSIIAMGIALESGKVIIAAWLHSNWHKAIPFWHRSYLVISLIILMTITSLGIFGYLSKATLDYQAPIAGDIAISKNVKDQITQKQEELKSLYQQMNTLAQDTKHSRERQHIQKQIETVNATISKLQTQQGQLSQKLSTHSQELGPARYLAQWLFHDGESNVDRAIQTMIAIIMIVFDPLALILLISALVSFKEKPTVSEIKIEEKQEVISKEVIEQPQSIDPVKKPTFRGWLGS